jgi:tetratricopeptide (TPR) repeat protein
MVPVWPKATAIIATFIFVVMMFSGALALASTLVPIFFILFNAYYLIAFEMVPLETTDKDFTIPEKRIPWRKVFATLALSVLVFFIYLIVRGISVHSIEKHLANRYYGGFVSSSVKGYYNIFHPYTGLNPNQLTTDKMHTYFTLAIVNENNQAIDAFLAKDFDVDYVVDGETALHVAIRHNLYDLAEKLIARGADILHKQRNYKGIERGMVDSFIEKFYLPTQLTWLAQQEPIYKDKKELKRILLFLHHDDRNVCMGKLLHTFATQSSVSEKALQVQFEVLKNIEDDEAQRRAIIGYFDQNASSYVKAGEALEADDKHDKALVFYKEAYRISQSHESAFKIAQLYNRDMEKAALVMQWYERAAKSGNDEALRILVAHYREENSYEEMIKLYTAVFKSGDVQKAKEIGQVYEQNLHDYEKAIEWYEKLLVQNNGEAEYHIADLYLLEKKESEKAKPYYLDALRKGFVNAAIRLIEHYPKLNLAKQKFIDNALALKIANTLYNNTDSKKIASGLYKKAYRSNDSTVRSEAALMLGAYYYYIEKEYQTAIAWYKKAKGWKEAYRNIGYIYYVHLDNDKESIKWYRLAHEAGDEDSALIIGTLYLRKNNFKSANEWLQVAVAQKKSDEAIDQYYGLYRAMKDKAKKREYIAYVISLTNTTYPRHYVMYTLRHIWSIPNEEIQKAYEVQLSYPKHYEGDLFDYRYEAYEY